MRTPPRTLTVLQRNAARRSYGDCTACCTTHGVEEIGKPDGEACAHLRPPTEPGCAIYETRPASCAKWSCLWRSGMFGKDDRPNVSGVVMDLTGEARDMWPGPAHQAFVARASRPGGLDEPAAEKLLTELSERFLVVLILDDKERVIIGPPAELAHVRERMAAKGFKI